MEWSDSQLSAIYDRTSGYCHICRKKLAFSNYACSGERGAWEVEHSVPRAAGGTDRLNNLFAACIDCNRSKGACSTRSCRGQGTRPGTHVGVRAERLTQSPSSMRSQRRGHSPPVACVQESTASATVKARAARLTMAPAPIVGKSCAN